MVELRSRQHSFSLTRAHLTKLLALRSQVRAAPATRGSGSTTAAVAAPFTSAPLATSSSVVPASTIPASNESAADLVHVFALLTRYHTLFGSGREFEGSGHQAAVPRVVLAKMRELFGACTESFASPLNCHLPYYCSAFADTDGPFGSAGSFFDAGRQVVGGCFECNPPFSEGLINNMTDRILRALHCDDDKRGSSTGHEEGSAGGPAAASAVTVELPLTFLVVLPDWSDQVGMERLKASPALRARLVLASRQHQYVSGFQHLEVPTSGRLHYSAVHATQVRLVMAVACALIR